ncbi:MAG TPA: hypothetical protein VGN61_12400 [Verrucomicrobiae bacterium]|jgi:hypothetical protein
MKTYLIVTCILFALMSLVHIARVVAEWSYPHGIGFAFQMAATIGLPAIFSAWAWSLLRRLPNVGAEKMGK